MERIPSEDARIGWSDTGVPVSEHFGDPYYSLQNGLAETEHVFLGGNGLPERFHPGFAIAETGFGTGLNALVAWASWRESGQSGRLSFTSFEAFPMGAGDMARALAPFREIAPLAERLIAAWADGARALVTEDFALSVVTGDARQTIPAWDGKADAWFLDGFAPAKNPELWGTGLLSEVARHTVQGGSFATYTAAGEVRRALAAAGFAVERVKGYGFKRHMTRGRMP